MKKRNLIMLASLSAVILALLGLYFLREYNRKIPDTAERKADYSMTAEQVIGAFAAGEKAANTKYLDKVLEISGTVKSVEHDEKGQFTVSIGDPVAMSSVRCSMDSLHNQEAAGLQPGTSIIIKGICTGYNADELLGSDVLLNRTAIIQKK